jgi:hypothetical protein
MIRRFAEGESILAKEQSGNIRSADRVTGLPNPNPPISIRMTPILVEELDRLAVAQHRKRANLIQHVLWDYVHAQKAAGTSPARKAKTAATVSRAPRKTRSLPKS